MKTRILLKLSSIDGQTIRVTLALTGLLLFVLSGNVPEVAAQNIGGDW